MAVKVCPQRIIAEAIRLLDECGLGPTSDPVEFEEAISNNRHELESLSRALYRDGIINIVEAPSHGG